MITRPGFQSLIKHYLNLLGQIYYENIPSVVWDCLSLEEQLEGLDLEVLGVTSHTDYQCTYPILLLLTPYRDSDVTDRNLVSGPRLSTMNIESLRQAHSYSEAEV